jgi:hypothetical protein
MTLKRGGPSWSPLLIGEITMKIFKYLVFIIAIIAQPMVAMNSEMSDDIIAYLEKLLPDTESQDPIVATQGKRTILMAAYSFLGLATQIDLKNRSLPSQIYGNLKAQVVGILNRAHLSKPLDSTISLEGIKRYALDPMFDVIQESETASESAPAKPPRRAHATKASSVSKKLMSVAEKNAFLQGDDNHDGYYRWCMENLVDLDRVNPLSEDSLTYLDELAALLGHMNNEQERQQTKLMMLMIAHFLLEISFESSQGFSDDSYDLYKSMVIETLNTIGLPTPIPETATVKDIEAYPLNNDFIIYEYPMKIY